MSFTITFAHETDPDTVKEILLEAGRGVPLALQEPGPSVFLLAGGALGLDCELDIYVADYVDGPQALVDALHRIWQVAKKKGVAFATARQEILFDRGTEQPAALSSERRRVRLSSANAETA